jgi:hypothetical protein
MNGSERIFSSTSAFFKLILTAGDHFLGIQLLHKGVVSIKSKILALYQATSYTGTKTKLKMFLDLPQKISVLLLLRRTCA